MDQVETEPAQSPPTLFQRWLDPSRAKPNLWRTVLGVILVVIVWLVWTVAVIAAWIVFRVLSGEIGTSGIPLEIDNLVAMQSPQNTVVMLATFAGIWVGVWIAMRLLHGGQRLATLFSPEGRIRWGEFAGGMVLVTGYFAISTLLSVVIGFAPERTDVALMDWLKVLPFMVVFIFIQSSGEEVFFRGYLVQHLGARFRSPLIWGLIPAFLFGLGHFTGGPDVVYGLYYIAATMLIGLTATALIWRTGSLSAAIGLHVANNMLAFMIAGPSDGGGATTLWAWDSSEMASGAPVDLLTLALLLIYVLSPWAPLAGPPLWGRRKDTRAAP